MIMKKAVSIHLFLMLGLNYVVFSQKDYDYGKTPEDSANCVKNYSLYNEYFKQNNYTDAIPALEATLQYCPKLSKSLYQNGSKMYMDMYEKVSDESTKKAFLEKNLELYDKRIEHFGQKGFVLGRKGVDWYKYKTGETEKAFEILKESFELSGENSEANPLFYLYVSLNDLYKQGKSSKQDMLDWYQKIAATLDKIIADPKKEKTKKGYESVQNEVDKIFSTVAECTDLNDIYTKKFNENSKDTVLLKTISKILNIRGCTDLELYYNAASVLHELNPSEESAYSLGVNQKENCSKAVEYFKQAADLSSNDENKQKYFLLAADCYKKMNQYSNARTYAQKALTINPNLGKAYILIGSCYVSSAGQCGDNPCTQKAAYWLAVDKFIKAKQVDPEIAEEANKLINTYSGYFPGKEDCFFYQITEGNSYTVNCWINETTTVRFNK